MADNRDEAALRAVEEPGLRINRPWRRQPRRPLTTLPGVAARSSLGETRPRDLVVFAAARAASLVVGLLLWALGLVVSGLIGYGIGGLLAAWPVYLLRRRTDREAPC